MNGNQTVVREEHAGGKFMPLGQLRRYLIPTITVLIGVILSLAAFRAVREQDRRMIGLEFEREAGYRCSAFEREMDAKLQLMGALQSFHNHAGVTRNEFKRFVEPFLNRYESIQALEWIPRVAGAEREMYESKGRQDGFPAFRISKRLISGRMARADLSAEYFPTYYIEPYQGNEIALGFDLATNPFRREALERSRDSGEMLATARFILSLEKQEQFGFMIFAPVYRSVTTTDSVKKRPENLAGFALGVFRIGDILEKSLSYLKPGGIDMTIYDRSAPEKESFLYYHRSRARMATSGSPGAEQNEPATGLNYAKTLNVAGRTWLVLCRPTPAFIASRESGRPLMTLGGGLLFTSLCAAYLAANIRWNGEIHRLNTKLELKVEERTRNLVETQGKLLQEEKLAMLGRIAGNMGNELRNPLGIMSNAVFYLKSVMPDAEETVREYLEIIVMEIDNSQSIISDLLDYCQSRSSRTEQVAVNTLINQSLEMCMIPENIEFQTDLPETLPQVQVDPLQMRQVFRNIITNAVQAMPDGGALRISARKVRSTRSEEREKTEPDFEPRSSNLDPDEDFIEISVIDSGVGISPENMKKVFQPLFTTKSRGIGLGLSICKNFVKANGGRIEVASELDKGTTFTVSLLVERGII